MSNSQAIAAVTSMLDYLITQGVAIGRHPDASMIVEKVTTRPPDKARKADATESQINIFLYQTAINAAWRNMDLPGRTRPGETGAPPLALNLCYLITAYGKDDNDVSAHRLLGHAMQILHDHSVISRGDIEKAGKTASLDPDQKSALQDADLHDQVDLLRITPLPLSLDELSRLWSTFQTPYRVSAVYEVSVVLIESARPVKTPLPVIRVSAQAHLIPWYPQLDKVEFRDKMNVLSPQPSILSGETLVLKGAQLDKDDGVTLLQFRHPNLADQDAQCKHPHFPDEDKQFRPIAKLSATAAEVAIPDTWPAGFYTVTAQVKGKGETGSGRTSNALSFALAPTITKIDLVNSAMTVTCTPAIAKGQRVSLLLGDRELLPQERKQMADPLTFDVTGVKGDLFVRLRVDGVDSHLIDRSQTPPVFFDDETHKVTLP